MVDDVIEDEDDEVAGPHAIVEDAVYTIGVAGQKYAINLIWNDVGNPANAQSEARAVAARPAIDADLFCLRANGLQYGLGKKDHGHVKNMPALAGYLADSQPGSWIGLFQVDGGYYVVAVKDDLVMPSTDKFYGDLIVAKAAFDNIRSQDNDWNNIYAPASEGIDGAKSVDIKSLFSGKATRLQDVDRVSSGLKLLIFAVVGAALIGGSMYLYKTWRADSFDASMEALKKQVASGYGAGKKGEEVRPPAPWEGHFKGVEYMEDCVASMKRTLVYVPGWKVKTLTCDKTAGVNVHLDREAELGNGGGTINWVKWAYLRDGLKESDFSSSATSSNGVDVHVTFLKQPDKYKPDIGPTAKIADVRRYLQSHYEEMFTNLTLPGMKAGQYFNSQDFTFITTFDPKTFSEVLIKIPGLVVNKVTLDLSKLTYTIEGQANEQLPLPEPGAKK